MSHMVHMDKVLNLFNISLKSFLDKNHIKVKDAYQV
jgi:hypothetical protein